MEWSSSLEAQNGEDIAEEEPCLVHAISLDKQPEKPALKVDAGTHQHHKPHQHVAFGGDMAEIAEHDPDYSSPNHRANRRCSREELRHKAMDVPVRVVVNNFYSKIIKHPRLSKFFNEIDIASLIRKQEAVMTYAFGGPELAREMNSVVDIRAIHEKAIREKGVTLHDFDEFVRLFEETLLDLEIPPETSTHAIDAIRSFRGCFTLGEDA